MPLRCCRSSASFSCSALISSAILFSLGPTGAGFCNVRAISVNFRVGVVGVDGLEVEVDMFVVFVAVAAVVSEEEGTVVSVGANNRGSSLTSRIRFVGEAGSKGGEDGGPGRFVDVIVEFTGLWKCRRPGESCSRWSMLEEGDAFLARPDIGENAVIG